MTELTIFGFTIKHEGWTPARPYMFTVRTDNLVLQLEELCATDLGTLKGAVELRKLNSAVHLSEKQALGEIAVMHPASLDDIAELMEHYEPLSTYFSEAPDKCASFLICPAQGMYTDRKRKADPTAEGYFKRLRGMDAPSEFGKIHEQTADDPLLLNHRPAEAAGIPVELLHDAFGVFRDSCSKYDDIEPRDIAFTVALCKAMSKYYDSETRRLVPFKAIFQEYYSLALHGIHIDRASTDATAIHGLFFIANIEAKNRPGSGGDPSLQNAGYYAKKILEMMENGSPIAGSRLPMLLIDIAGPFLSISGAALGSKITIDPLVTLNLANSSRELVKCIPVFKALRLTMEALTTYYNQLALPGIPPDQRQFPYYTGSRENSVTLTYQQPLIPKVNRLLFSATNTSDTKNPHVVVKFAERYGAEAHQFCADAGIAPKLIHTEQLAGGWTVVVMERVLDGFTLFVDLNDQERKELGPTLRLAVSKMHNEGYVHGDLRRANVFGNLEKKSVCIIDWDWAGKENAVRYPLLAVPTASGVQPQKPILKLHDERSMEVILASGIERR